MRWILVIVFLLLIKTLPAQELTYTGAPDLIDNLTSVSVKSEDGYTYELLTNMDGKLNKVSFSNGLIHKVLPSNCMENIYFPELQTFRLSTKYVKNYTSGYKEIRLLFSSFNNMATSLNDETSLKENKLTVFIDSFEFTKIVITTGDGKVITRTVLVNSCE